MPYVNKRWLGGLLTNFNTMSGRIARLHELNGWKEEGKLALLPTKERMKMEAELAKLEFNLGGVRDMDRLPDAVFVTDLKTEEIAVHEAARLRIPIIGLVDTNCDPTPVDYVIPGNDDAIRSCQLIIGTIGSAVEEGAACLARAGGEADRRRDGTAQTRRGRAQETRGGRESPPRRAAGQTGRGRSGQTGRRQSRGRKTAESRCRAGRSRRRPRPKPQQPARPRRRRLRLRPLAPGRPPQAPEAAEAEAPRRSRRRGAEPPSTDTQKGDS